MYVYTHVEYELWYLVNMSKVQLFEESMLHMCTHDCACVCECEWASVIALNLEMWPQNTSHLMCFQKHVNTVLLISAYFKCTTCTCVHAIHHRFPAKYLWYRIPAKLHGGFGNAILYTFCSLLLLVIPRVPQKITRPFVSNAQWTLLSIHMPACSRGNSSSAHTHTHTHTHTSCIHVRIY